MNRTRRPCPQHCPERSPTCHATCKTYLEHHAERELDIVAFKVDAKKRLRNTKDWRRKRR
jgi:hypothetical protein